MNNFSMQVLQALSGDSIYVSFHTKIEFFISGLGLHRDTASKYLRELEGIDILESIKIGRSKFFVNKQLFHILKKGI